MNLDLDLDLDLDLLQAMHTIDLDVVVAWQSVVHR